MADVSLFANLHFLRPQWFLLLIPFVMISVIHWRSGDLGRQWQAVIAQHLLNKMLVPGSQRQLFSPLWISMLVIPLLVVALAGPSWTRGESPFAQDSASLVIAVDLSESMASDDLLPSRLQRARSKIMALARARGDAYTALVAYAGSGHGVLPLSNDGKMLLHYLDALQVGMLPKRGKSPELILPHTLDLLGENGGTLLLVTDGANPKSIEAFSRLSKDSNLQVVVWGMGKTSQQIAADSKRGLKSSALGLVESDLMALADAAKGDYVPVSADDSDIKQLLRAIDRHFQLSEDSSRPWLDGGYYFVAPVMLFFLLWFRKGWALRW